MKDIEALRAKHEEEIRQAEEENAILKSLPETLNSPARVVWQAAPEGKGHPRFPWLCYDVKTVKEAALLAQEFGALLPVQGVRTHCLHISPERYLTEKAREDGELQWQAEDGLKLNQHAGKGFRSLSLDFWPASGRFMVHVDIKDSYLPHGLAATVSCTYDRYGEPSQASRRVSFPRLSNYDIQYAAGSPDSINCVSLFEGPEHILRVLCAKEG